MISVYVKSGEVIKLGREGTYGVRRVVFDFSRWVRLFGDGVVRLAVRRPGDKEVYFPELTIDGENAVWNVDETDTATAGEGECEFQYSVGPGLEKSETFKTYIQEALDEDGEEGGE